MQIIFNCEKVVNKLQGKYKFHITRDKALIAIKDGLHGRLSMLELASILFCGTRTIPPRPMFLDYVKDRQQFLEEQFLHHITVEKRSSISDNKIADVYINLNAQGLGNVVLIDIQKWVLSGSYYKSHVPNAPSTIANKGSDVPLVDKGALLNSIYSQVVKGQ